MKKRIMIFVSVVAIAALTTITAFAQNSGKDHTLKPTYAVSNTSVQEKNENDDNSSSFSYCGYDNCDKGENCEYNTNGQQQRGCCKKN